MPDATDQQQEPSNEAPTLDKRPIFPPPVAPLNVAHELYIKHHEGRVKTLVCWNNSWWKWRTTHWAELDVAELRSRIYRTLGTAIYEAEVTTRGVTETEQRPWNPDKRKVANVLEAMAAVGHLSTECDQPCWIVRSAAADPPASQIISCTNGLLDLGRRELTKHTPRLFNAVRVPFDYQPDAPEPKAWLAFLATVWPSDPDSIALLQEYIGYLISGRTDMQKLLLLIGPSRSGKGTIARLITELIGRGHVAGPTLAGLGTNFGLSPLLAKPLAIVSDARLGDTPSHTVVERLLSITGEDMLTVDRKFREPWSGKLPTRFVILSNELPKFRDSSGAIANRMLILQMTQSFLGREDTTLDARLRPELPGILLWALDGLDRLNRNGRFTVPKASQVATNLMMDLASPISAFVRDRCILGPDKIAAVDQVFDAWKLWAGENGHAPGSKVTFGRNLHSVLPTLRPCQPTVAGKRIRAYTGIYVCNGLNPLHPVHGSLESARTASCTGCGRAEDAANPLVEKLCTGCTGQSALPVPYGEPAQDESRADGLRRAAPPSRDSVSQAESVAQRLNALAEADHTAKSTEQHCACGEPLIHPDSQALGMCVECRLAPAGGYASTTGGLA